MRVEFGSDIDEFAVQAWPLLAADEANHTQLLRALANARNAGLPPGEPWHAALVHGDEGRVTAAARRFQDTWFVTTGPDAALQALGDAVRAAAGADTPAACSGCVGEANAVRAFERGYGTPMRVHFDLRLFRLDGEPMRPPPAEAAACGRLQRATLDDLPALLELAQAFRDEARLADTAEQVAAGMPQHVQAGSQYLWFDAQGALAGFIGGQSIPPSGARVGPVYTRPAQRGRGIGAAMVATLSRQLLAAGARCVFLFTDASNPTSNALYPRIGFAPIGRHLHLRVDRAG